MNKTAAAFGTIWGVFAMIFSLFLFLVVFAPVDMQCTDFGIFGSSVFAYYDGTAFGIEAWAVAAGAFGLAALGLIGAGIVRQHHIFAGILLLISSVGMFIVAFQPVFLAINNNPGSILLFASKSAPEAALALLVTILIGLLGFLGSVFSLAAKPRLARHATRPEMARTRPAFVPAQSASRTAAPQPPAPDPAPAPAAAQTQPATASAQEAAQPAPAVTASALKEESLGKPSSEE